MGFVGKFFAAVVIVGTAELMLLLKVASGLGFLATALLCVLTGIAGGALVRAQGLSTLTRIHHALRVGQAPADEMVSGAILVLVGALLVTPGFLTDAIGFALLVPRVRVVVAQGIVSRFSFFRGAGRGTGVIDVYDDPSD